MFEIVYLGTSASAPSIYRGLPAMVVIAGEYRFLVDCGEGTQRQLLRSGIGFKRLNRILLTHSHLDHILGLGGLVSTFVRWENLETLEIYGGQKTLSRVEALLYGVVLYNEQPPMQLHLVDLKPGVFFEGKDFTARAFPVTHRGSGNFGFVFEEKSRRPFLVEQAEALGVPAGPVRSQLVKGETVTLDDGRVITPDMVLGEEIRGAKVVHIGDVGRTDNIIDHVRDADVLSIEATFLHEEDDVARQFGHITARRSAELARDANVKALVLTHLSRRYRERDIAREAREVFPNTTVARDLDHYIVHRDRPLQKKQAEG